MNSTKKRFKSEQEILAAIELCHTQANALALEAETLENEANAIIRKAHDIESETIALCEVPPVPTAKKAIEAELKRWDVSPETLLCYMQAWGAAKKIKHYAGLNTDDLAWACKVWPQLLNYHVTQLRKTASEKLKLAKRTRTSAHNKLHVKAVELGKKLAVMQTVPMAFLSDISIPAA